MDEGYHGSVHEVQRNRNIRKADMTRERHISRGSMTADGDDWVSEARNVICSGIGKSVKADSLPMTLLKRIRLTSVRRVAMVRRLQGDRGRP